MPRSAPSTSRRSVRYRRSPAVAMYWSDAGLASFEFKSGRRRPMPAEVLDTLRLLDQWTTVRQFARKHPDYGAAADIQDLFEALVGAGLAERDDAAGPWPWHGWSPEAAFFHFGTRGGRYADDLGEHDRMLRAKATHDPPPPPTKRIDGATIPLPAPQPLGQFARTLRERRTWRNFSARPVTVSALATLLQLTWGVQKQASVPGQGEVVLKTSPSGGARHPVEAYVIALNVSGLSAGVFHYDAAAHHLTDLRRPVGTKDVIKVLAGQQYFAGASAFIVMSAVFARSMWRYAASRAYRVLLADAGHLAQTFCLTATAMRLAPFCTMAFDDESLDRLIGVDGVAEGAVYVVGVGTRPTAAVRPGAFQRDRV